MSSKKNTKDAQILIITLLVLMILAVIVVGIVTLASKDAKQVSSNKKYTEIGNEVESVLNQKIRECEDPANSCLNLTQQIPVVVNSQEIITNLNVTETNQVERFEVPKDGSFEMVLFSGDSASGFTYYYGNVALSWDKQAAMDFSLTYKDLSGNYGIIKDVYDKAGIYDSLAGDSAYGGSAMHAFNFQPLGASYDPSQSVGFAIRNTSGLGANLPVSLRITPRTRNQLDTISLNISGEANLPNQVRKFVGEGYINGDPTTPVVTLETLVPLYPQLDSVFDYSFLTEGGIATN